MTSILCPECGVAWPEHSHVCGREPVKQADMPLVCRIEGQQLVIRIGIDTLAFASEHCEAFYDDEKHAHSGPPYVKIIDKSEFLRDVCSALLYEREDGTTPLHLLLDQAALDARDNGSLAFEDDSD